MSALEVPVSVSAMKNVKDYLKLARECRKLAQNATVASHRSNIEKIAEAWETMATQRQEGNDRRRQHKEHKKHRGGARSPHK